MCSVFFLQIIELIKVNYFINYKHIFLVAIVAAAAAVAGLARCYPFTPTSFN